jgi:putative oxidoreductase
MNTALWVAQTVLAALYLMAGLWKVAGQGPMLKKMMPGLSLALIRVVGLGEALAGLGLVLPAAARSWAAVAGWAGAILAVEAAAFVVYRLRHGAYVPAGATVILGLLAAFVAWGRLK